MILTSDAADNAPDVVDPAGQIDLVAAALELLKDGGYLDARVQVGRVFERKGQFHVADASMRVGSSPYRTPNDDVFVRLSLHVPGHLLCGSALGEAVAAQAHRSEAAHRAARVTRLNELTLQVAAIDAERAKLEADIAEIDGRSA